MTRSKRFFYTFIILLSVFAVFVSKWYFFDRNPKKSGDLRVESFPQTTVFLNEKEIGSTPLFKDKIPSGEYNLNLVNKAQSWQTKIKINDGALTYVSRNIGPAEDQSSGQILTLERLSLEKSSELAIIASPDDAKITLDGLDKGTGPLLLRDIQVGDHVIVISKEGFSDQIVKPKVIAGYRVNAIIKLGALANQARSTADLVATSAGITKPYVIISNTPTGFLRVRFEPSISSSETGQVKPGEKYPLLSEVEGWVKIKLANVFGWVSDQYIQKFK